MSINSYLNAIDSEVTNQADMIEIARTALLNKAAGGGITPFYTEDFTISETFTSGSPTILATLPNTAAALRSHFTPASKANSIDVVDFDSHFILAKFELKEPSGVAGELLKKYVLTGFHYTVPNGYLYFLSPNYGFGVKTGSVAGTFSYAGFDQFGLRLHNSSPEFHVAGRISATYVTQLTAGDYRLSLFDLDNILK